MFVHAYVLMTNHLHLLAMPQHKASLPKALQSVGRRYDEIVFSVNQNLGVGLFDNSPHRQ